MATVWEHVGNIFESDCNVIMHQANCFTTMGAGIAREVKMRYPSAYEADVNHPIARGSKDRLGRYSFAWVDDHSRLIVNLYGQHRYGRDQKHTEENKLKKAMTRAFTKLEEYRFTHPEHHFKIGIPYNIGCGLAGGDWKEVYSIIEDLSNEFGVDVHLYRLK